MGKASARVTRGRLRRFAPDGGLRYRLLALPEYNCVYVKNPKAGCSTITLWLHRVHTGDHQFTPTNVHREHQLSRPRDIGLDRMARMLDGEGFRFSFVRDPVRRVESAYRDKIVALPSDKHRRRLREVLGMPQQPGVPLTLDEFVAALEATDPLEMDLHWRPQHLNLMHPLVSYDLIGRLESFDVDLARVRDAVGLPDAPVQVRNSKAGRDGGSLFDGRQGLLRRVREVYARDFELYGY